ncbi:MAG: hypothetical protein AMXMBFR48_22690 [Ignavibacteriales bacterium]
MTNSDKVIFVTGKMAEGAPLDNNLFNWLFKVALDNVKSILTKRNQKFCQQEIEDLAADSLLNYIDYLNRHRNSPPAQPDGYFYAICRNAIYKNRVVDQSPEYAYFRIQYSSVIKKLEIEGKIFSQKESAASSKDKFGHKMSPDDIPPEEAAVEFTINLLLTEERWTQERKNELEELVLHILKTLPGSISLKELERCVSDRIYIQQNDTVTIFDDHEESENPTTPVDLSEDNSELSSEQQKMFEDVRKQTVEELTKLAYSNKTTVRRLKAWRSRYILENTLETVAKEFNYGGASGAESAVKNRDIRDFLDKVQLLIIEISDEEQLVLSMRKIILDDLDRLIEGLEERLV